MSTTQMSLQLSVIMIHEVLNSRSIASAYSEYLVQYLFNSFCLVGRVLHLHPYIKIQKYPYTK